jgi:hypothetical protein
VCWQTFVAVASTLQDRYRLNSLRIWPDGKIT